MNLKSFLTNPFKPRKVDERFRFRIPIHGEMRAMLIDRKENKIVQFEHVPNTVVDAGEIWMAELLAHKYAADETTLGTPLLDGLQYIAVGTDGNGTAVTQDDVSLGTKATTNSCIAATTDIDTTDKNKFLVSATFGSADGNGNLREAGIFADDIDTTEPTTETYKTNRMFNRTTFGTIAKTTNFDLTLEWTITVGTLT